jgi:hypothetical protein
MGGHEVDGSEHRQIAVCSKEDKKPSGSIKLREFLD